MSEQDKPTRFDAFTGKAEKLVQSPSRMRTLVASASRKLGGAGKFNEVKDQLGLFIAMVKAWLSGDYRDVSSKSFVVVVAALLYFVVPLDVIPDFLFGWGFIDDIAVITYVFGQLTDELEAFKAWQNQQQEKEVESDVP